MLDMVEKVVNVDGAIILGFLLLNLLVGIYFGRGITSLKEYCLGNRNFSTATIAYTIIATYIAGDSLSIGVYQTYKYGMYYMIPLLGDVFAFFIIAFLFLPRMHSFLGSLSIAEAMGDRYGNVIRGCTAFVSLILCIGNIAAEFIILTMLLINIMNISVISAGIFSCLIVITYSTIGGIKSITFTDVLQFFAFGLIMPLTVFLIWQQLDDGIVINTLTMNPIFDLNRVLDYKNPKFFDTLFLFIFYLIPAVDPALFQRVSMARNIKQAVRSFIIAGIIFFVCKWVIMNFIGVLLLSDPMLNIGNDDSSILPYILNRMECKGLFIVGIIAMSMSTADSYMNSAAILISYDLRKVMGIQVSEKQELLLMRITVLFIGVLSLYACTYFVSFVDLLIKSYSFYMAIVTVPFVITVFGFRTTTTPIFLGMLAGFMTVIYVILLDVQYGLIIAILANFLTCVGSHYLMNIAGGWVGVIDNGTFLEIKRKRKEAIDHFFSAIQNFSIVTYLINGAKKQESNYVYLGFFCAISLFFNLCSLPKIVVDSNWDVIRTIAYITLFLSTILISYPAWLPRFKSPLFIGIVYFLTIFVSLILFNSLLALISSFSTMQDIILTVSIITGAILLELYTILLFIITGILLAAVVYARYIGGNIGFNSITVEASLIYMIVMTGALSIVFLKPKADTLVLFKAKSSNLWQKVNDMDKEVRSANNLKTEFLANISHEVRSPITGITSLGQALYDNYDQVPESKRRECVKVIAKNSERLISLMNNILDFSNLSSLKMPLNLKKINITEMVYDSLRRCKKLYLEDKELYFKLDIEDDVYTKCDVHYISHTIENLIINAICYSKPETTVRIFLQQNEGLTYFAIRDEGIGIPKEELKTIFNPFTTSTKTKSTAGGRGIGLALCYAVITAHKGRIWAESDGSSWAEFSFEIENTA